MINKNREIMCFVCSEMQPDLNQMQMHVVDNHREGDDYVICPCCKVPVRDLIPHYRSKHIGMKIPENIQVRAIILRDVHKNRKHKFKQGSYISQKTNRTVQFRSGLELKLYQKLEKNLNVRDYRVENIMIEYFFDGRSHNYIPDVLVEYTNGKIELWEIKPKSQTKWPKNIAKWTAANIYCKKRNWEFIVVTENALKKPK